MTLMSDRGFQLTRLGETTLTIPSIEDRESERNESGWHSDALWHKILTDGRKTRDQLPTNTLHSTR